MQCIPIHDDNSFYCMDVGADSVHLYTYLYISVRRESPTHFNIARSGYQQTYESVSDMVFKTELLVPPSTNKDLDASGSALFTGLGYDATVELTVMYEILSYSYPEDISFSVMSAQHVDVPSLQWSDFTMGMPKQLKARNGEISIRLRDKHFYSHTNSLYFGFQGDSSYFLSFNTSSYCSIHFHHEIIQLFSQC